jgi:hypothetical protein
LEKYWHDPVPFKLNVHKKSEGLLKCVFSFHMSAVGTFEDREREREYYRGEKR